MTVDERESGAAVRGRDRDVRRRAPRAPPGDRDGARHGPARPGADVPAASARRPRQLRRGAGDARAPARTARRGSASPRRRWSSSRSTSPSWSRRSSQRRSSPIAAVVVAARTSASGAGAAAISSCSNGSATRSCPCRCSRVSPRPRSAAPCTRATSGRPQGCSDARRSWTGSSSAATSEAARSATRPRTWRSSRRCSSRPTGSTRARRSAIAPRSRSARIPHYGGDERRIEPHLLDFDGDLYGRRLVVELWERLRDEQVFASEQALIDQIARDVESTRKAVRPA